VNVSLLEESFNFGIASIGWEGSNRKKHRSCYVSILYTYEGRYVALWWQGLFTEAWL